MSKSKIYISTLRPGLLVNIKTSIKGNVSYDKGEEKVTVRKGVEISEWETTKFVQDPAEQEAAVEIRSKARNLIVGVCAVSEFGLLSPVLGFVTAFVAAVIAVRWMVGYLQNHSLAIFGWYRLGVAALTAVLIFASVIEV